MNELSELSNLKNTLFRDVFSSEEMVSIKNSQQINKLVRDKYEIPSEYKVHICKMVSGVPNEMMAMSSISNDFDLYMDEKEEMNWTILNVIKTTIIFFIESNEHSKLSEYKILNCIVLGNEMGKIEELNDDINLVIYNLKLHLSNNDRMKSINSKYLVCKPKDSKPYREMYSEYFGRIVSDCSYGWYFTKEFLIYLNECFNEKKEISAPKDFYKLISQLKTSSNESVTTLEDNYNIFDDLYIERLIEKDIKEKLLSVKSKQLIFLVGNSGDGKSTILRRLKRATNLFDHNFKIHNDATESFYPDKDSIETLLEILEPYSDLNIKNDGNSTLIAINMGIIGKLLDHNRISEFAHLRDYILNSNLLKDGKQKEKNHEVFDYFSFTEYNIFTVSEKSFESKYINEMFDKVFIESSVNPFYKAYDDLDVSIKTSCPVAINFKLMQKSEIRQFIIKLLSLVHIKEGVLFTSRILWNFIYELLFDENLEHEYSKELSPITGRRFISLLLPNKLFNRNSDNEIIQCICKQSSIVEESHQYDIFLHELFSFSKVQLKDELEKKNYFGESKIVIESISLINSSKYKNDDAYKHESNRMLAMLYAVDYNCVHLFTGLDEYAKFIYKFNNAEVLRNDKDIRNIKEILVKVIKDWNGKHPKNEYMHTTFSETEFMKSVSFDSSKLKFVNKNKIRKRLFYYLPHIEYDGIIGLDIDYKLFSIINEIHQGYQLNSLEKLDFIRLNEFVTNLVYHCTDGKEQHITTDNSSFIIKVNEYNEFEIRKE